MECAAVRLLHGLPCVSFFEELAIQLGGEARGGFSGFQA